MNPGARAGADAAGLKAGIFGCCGRLGKLTLAAMLRDPAFALAACCTSAASPWIARDAGSVIAAPDTGIAIGCDADALCAASEVAIDFSAPEGTAQLAAAAARHGCALVTGTTGLADAQQQAVIAAASDVPVVQASHMSLAATLMIAAVEHFASQLDDAYDVEVVGIAHRNKADVPSGTSFALARAAAAARGADESAIHTAPGEGPRARGGIGISAWRGGANYSEHKTIFAGRGDRLEISHAVTSYEICAEGALRAALWVRGRAPGLYDMRDVLGLRAARNFKET
jgi:4-hydroxy-tetrahydrodipicolinate reductase